MKTPTQAILGYSELLEQYTEKSPEIVATLKRNDSRLQRLTNGILYVSRIESQTLKLNIEKVNINEQIQNVLNDVESQIQNPGKLKIVFPNHNMLYTYNQTKQDYTRLYQTFSLML